MYCVALDFPSLSTYPAATGNRISARGEFDGVLRTSWEFEGEGVSAQSCSGIGMPLRRRRDPDPEKGLIIAL